jgi:putative tryptophan/tyrosine transport system substrate-binding protein
MDEGWPRSLGHMGCGGRSGPCSLEEGAKRELDSIRRVKPIRNYPLVWRERRQGASIVSAAWDEAADDGLNEMRDRPKSIGRELILAAASNADQLDSAFAVLAENRPGGVVIPTNAFFLAERQRIIMLAANHKIAAIYDVREFAEAGGLISYGQSTERFRQVGVYVGKILHGAKPADLPVVRPSKFELVVNHKTAKTLGLDIPPTLLASADEVIE